MTQIKKSYDEWDMPPTLQGIPISQRDNSQDSKKSKKPSTKPKQVIEPVLEKIRPEDFLIKKLVSGLRKYLPKLDIRTPKPGFRDDSPLGNFISNIFYNGQRIGYIFQNIGAERVFLHFEKGSNIAIWSDGLDIRKIAKIIKNEIEKNYNKKSVERISLREI